MPFPALSLYLLCPQLTSSNFLALYWSAPLRKLSRMMSQSTVPWRREVGRPGGAALGWVGAGGGQGVPGTWAGLGLR